MNREHLRRTLREPEPIWPEAPRLVPHRRFPPYRFVLGLNPHPTRSPDGHLHGHASIPSLLPAPHDWRSCEDYLFGIDLYHRSYFWEAHEVWEGLWEQTERRSIQARFLQGLIQNSAAQLKAHRGTMQGAAQISEKAINHLIAVREADKGDRYMGIDVATLVGDMERHYGPLWKEARPSSTAGRPPRLDVG